MSLFNQQLEIFQQEPTKPQYKEFSTFEEFKRIIKEGDYIDTIRHDIVIDKTARKLQYRSGKEREPRKVLFKKRYQIGIENPLILSTGPTTITSYINWSEFQGGKIENNSITVMIYGQPSATYQIINK